MTDLKLGEKDIKGLLNPQGIFHILTEVKDLGNPFTPTDGELVSLSFDTGTDKEMQLGGSGSVTLGINADTKAKVLLLWPSSKQEQLKNLEDFDMTEYFSGGAHADQLLVFLQIAPAVEAGGDAKTEYGILKRDASLKAGVNASYGMASPFPKNTPARDVLKAFFKEVRLPAAISEPPAPGEAISFEFGGSLAFGANLGLGYEMSGSPSVKIKDLTLSENYRLSLMGSLGFQSQVAGRFVVLVRQGSKPGWARVKVQKSKNKSFSLAADVSMGGTLDVQGLPDSPNEFLESLLGLKAKNWLNLFDTIKDYTDFEQLEAKLDGLAKNYIQEFTGEAFEKLGSIETLNKVIDSVNKAITSYQNLGDYAVSLFDRFYDPIAQKVDDKLVNILDKIDSLNSLDQLRSKVLGEELTEVLFSLTDGKPLDWLLGKIKINNKTVDSLLALKERAGNVTSLIKDKAHQEIRDVITTAKSKFPLDHFITNLKTIDLEQLQADADEKLIGFAERIIGKSFKTLSESELGKAVREVNKAMNAVDDFKNNLYEKVKKSMNQSLQVNMQLGYNRAKENDALIDVEINLQQEEGKKLMKAAGRGDFSKVLEDYDPKFVRLNSGVFTHQVTRKCTVSVNMSGWHKDFKYRKMTELITNSEQHVKSEANGMLTVTTDIKLDTARETCKNGESIYTNMVLALAGASNGAAVYDKETQRYLVDAITNVSRNYKLMLKDGDTTPVELQEYLQYAVDFGIMPTKDEAVRAIAPLMSRDEKGNYGSTSLSYDVRFTPKDFKDLFNVDINVVAPLRRIIRQLTLTNYLSSGEQHLQKLGWCYWTGGIYNMWRENPVGFTTGPKAFKPIAASPVKSLTAPGSVTLDRGLLTILGKLYAIEDDIIEGVTDLLEIIKTKKGLSPLEYEKGLGKLAKAFNAYDSIDESENTFLAIFNAVIEASGRTPVRKSSLTLKSQLPGQPERTKMLMA
ncbi:MAG: hypothetical protein KAW12_05970 [Candidatus Aminicenantes bacterium]|nr:hypothetical protein [Candidatus Aminicenantes bacterium]